MARIVNSTLTRSRSTLTPAERRRAVRLLEKAQERNPLRRVRLDCHGWVRDSAAVVGDWIWCTKCEDHRRVAELKE